MCHITLRFRIVIPKMYTYRHGVMKPPTADYLQFLTSTLKPASFLSTRICFQSFNVFTCTQIPIYLIFTPSPRFCLTNLPTTCSH